MFEVACISNPEQKRKLLEAYLHRIAHGEKVTWVVSDLRHKFEIQSLILGQQDYFEDLNVIRASELWRFLFKRTHPDWKIVSNEFLKTWIKDQIRKRPEALSALQSSQSDQVVFDMMNTMAPLWGHPLGKQKIREWLSQHPESLQRWGGWFLLAEELFDQMTENKKVCLNWLSGLMQSEQMNWTSFWSRPLIFDLRSQMSQIEADLIKNLSQVHEVTVIAPKFESESDFKYLLKPYDFLLSHGKKIDLTKQSSERKIQGQVFRFSGPLAEAKNACHRVRDWLDQGILASQIAIIAPDIEQYWPLLDSLLEVEGIPVAKDRTVRLQSLPIISEWMAQLKISSGDFNYSDLERAAYVGDKPHLRFEEFHALFSEMLTEVDLKRHQDIEKSFKSKEFPSGDMATEEFIGYSLRYWKDRSQFSYLEICIRELMAHSEISMNMNLSAWLGYLSQIVAKKEMSVHKGFMEGIQVTNLSSADFLNVSHRVFLGLAESMIQGFQKSIVGPEEIQSISSEIGFDLQQSEVSSDEFDLEWLSRHSLTTDIFSFPQTGFSGSAEAPCALWLSHGGHEQLNIPSAIRWDFVESQKPSADLRIFQDLGEKKLEQLQLKKPIPLSPSSIESYRQCPFIFAAQKIFRLMDFPILDLDVDRRTKGLLAHGLLEKLTTEPRRYDYSDDEIRQIIEGLREPLGLRSMDDFIWRGMKEKHRALAVRFLEFEKQWKQKFPQTKTVAVEKNFEYQFKDQWTLRGKIDRIDSDDLGNLVVIDYKVSPSDYKNFSSWLSENQIQLGLYMLALESKSLEPFSSQEVVGAFYYVLKTMNRDKGLKIEEKSGSLYELDRKKNRISLEGKKQLLLEISRYVAETIQSISEGIIDPNPLDAKDCVTCHWRSLCRAPHLN